MAKVIYNGNGNTGGSIPVDNTDYGSGTNATVLGVASDFVRNSDIFAYWNDAANGLGNVIGPGSKIPIGSSDVNLYAAWYTYTGLLPAGGITTHYQFRYDSALATAAGGNVEPARTNLLILKCETDFDWMNGLFNNIGLPYSYPVSVQVANLGGGAGWGPPITLKGNGGDENLLRDFMVAEVTEMFMYQQALLGLSNHGYGFQTATDNEDSNGEGLSHYLEEQFGIRDGRPPTGDFNGGQWLNSSLPSGTPGNTRFSSDTPPYDYQSRYDYVNKTIDDNRDSPASGCSALFCWFLTVQLGFTPAEICQNAALTYGGVYNNLTGDNGNPFPVFKALLDNAYPQSAVATIPGPNPDNPFPLALLSFWVDKSTFGKDEVLDTINSSSAGKFPNAFWLVVEGFNKNTFDSLGVTLPSVTADFTGAFAAINGISISRSATPIDYENSNPKAAQRIRISYDITFTDASQLNTIFPASGDVEQDLNASAKIGGNLINSSQATTVFELIAGADPYFTNIDPTQNNVYYLSQDVRVFTATYFPGQNNVPVAGGPTLLSDDVTGAFNYIQALIPYLNNHFNNPSSDPDPFTTILPGQSGAYTGDSSVSQFHIDFSGIIPQLRNNYNFAIARVRLRDIATAFPVNNVKVFFRLWQSQTPDTDFQPGSTYLSTNVGGKPDSPLVGAGDTTFPFFATGNLSGNTDYSAGGINNRIIQNNGTNNVWAYFGCFLNLYDANNIIDGKQIQNYLQGTHHCIVAQIAFDDAPINAAGASPENSDKLAQRNLQLTYSDNPGIAATHRIPQTFDIRPSKPLLNIPGSLLNFPDELMIDWGNTPVGSIASIYWPRVNASDVLNLAQNLYGTNLLSSSDSHTITCEVTKGVTYIPIPPDSGENFAGLFTVDLPTTVVSGQEFNIIVRRITTKQSKTQDRLTDSSVVPPRTDYSLFASGQGTADSETATTVQPTSVVINTMKNWRYVTGTFQVKIPVTTKEVMLYPEENTLAIMKWRLKTMSPANRWYPVLQRYIIYISARIDGLGGDSDSIKPSLTWNPFKTVNGNDAGKDPEKDCECSKVKNRCVSRLIIAIVAWIAFWTFAIWAAIYIITINSLCSCEGILIFFTFATLLITSIWLINEAYKKCN